MPPKNVVYIFIAVALLLATSYVLSKLIVIAQDDGSLDQCFTFDPLCHISCPFFPGAWAGPYLPWCEITLTFIETNPIQEELRNRTMEITSIDASPQTRTDIVEMINNAIRNNTEKSTVVLRNEFNNDTTEVQLNSLGTAVVSQIDNIAKETADNKTEFIDVGIARYCSGENETCSDILAYIGPTFGLKTEDLEAVTGPSPSAWALLGPGMYATCIFSGAAGWVAGEGEVGDIPWQEVKDSCNPFA